MNKKTQRKIVKACFLAAMLVIGYVLLLRWESIFYGTKSKNIDPLSVPMEGTIKLENDLFYLFVNKTTGNLDQLVLKGYSQTSDSPERLELLSAKRPYTATTELLANSNQAVKFTGSEVSGNRVVLTFEDENKIVKSIYEVGNASYVIKNKLEFTNKSSENSMINVVSKIKGNVKSHFDEQGDASLFASTYIGGAFSNPDDRFQKIDLDGQNLETKGQKDSWVGFLNHYFLTAWMPTSSEEFVIFGKSGEAGTAIYGTLVQKDIAPKASYTYEANLYAGPKIQEVLDLVNPTLGLTIDYGWLWFLSELLMVVMKFYYSLVGDWGISIILLTLSLKVLFFKLNQISYRSMAKMKLLAPKLAELKERYGENKEQYSKEMMQLYQREKVNPFSGCFPILLQMPVFISLYWMLYESIEIRQVAFLWVPDLASFDPLFIFPLIMGGGMVLQQVMTPTTMDPQQAKIMRIMPIVFTFLFLWFPAGVTIYWATNNTLSLLQQWIINKQMKVD